ncbi:MAG: biotin carboxylase N-terminal domain-containing protein [Bdellovibrionota bacterium]
MARKIEKLAIANRGEVAVRIIRAAQELGIETILLHSEADVASLAYRLADKTVLIGPSNVQESYLNIEMNINAAISADADAIHPGFGFLSENADFAEAAQKARMIFVGPSAQSIRLFGDKISAKNLVKKAGGPTVPGYEGEDQTHERLISEAKRIGFPVMVKAAGGGGGRGLRVIRSEAEAKSMIEAAQREGMSAFKSDKVFLEKYLDHAKHIEFQVFGDSSGKVYHLYDRECSVQRRHQKLIEESLSAKLDHTVREKMAKVAIEIAETAQYKGAGTVEFLFQDGEFYFMEMNTRLQVEHPVTELVLGVDLVKAQILTAMGKPVLWEQRDLIPRGHAIECRINVEDPQTGMPSIGVLGGCYWPHGPGRRFEVGFEPGDEITGYYDSMIAKVIVWDETRYRAIQKMKRTLRDTIIFGLKTNIPYLMAILSHPEFVEGEMTTQFIEKNFAKGLAPQDMSDDEKIILEELKYRVSSSQSSGATGSETEQPSPWKVLGARP